MNHPVDFTQEAIKDLSDIASYTAETWGYEQALRYAELLDGRFKEIAKGKIFTKAAFSNYPNVRVCRCELDCRSINFTHHAILGFINISFNPAIACFAFRQHNFYLTSNKGKNE